MGKVEKRCKYRLPLPAGGAVWTSAVGHPPWVKPEANVPRERYYYVHGKIKKLLSEIEM